MGKFHCMAVPHFVHLSIDELWVISTFLVIMNNSVTMYKLLCRYIFSSQVCTLGVDLLGRLVALCLIFLGTNKLCFKDAVPFYILIISTG